MADQAQAVLGTAMEVVSTAAGVVGTGADALYGAAASAVAAVPVPESVSTVYATVAGDMPIADFATTWLPILYVSVMPILCCVFGLCGACAGPKKVAGNRIMRRINIAVSAHNRLLTVSPPKKYKGVTSLSDAEKGKSPIKNKAAVRRPARSFA